MEYQAEVNGNQAEAQKPEPVLDVLPENEARFRALVENTSDILWEIDQDAVYTYCSPNIASILGYTIEEVVGRTPFEFMPPEEAKRVSAVFRKLAVECKPFSLLSHKIRYKDGRIGFMESSGTPVVDEKGQFRGYRGIDRDVTRRKQLEEQLRQAQKMEAIGRLAGGIAHDFNNLLAAIGGYAESALTQLLPGDPLRKDIEEIAKAADRGASFIRQLLTVSRRKPADFRIFDLNTLVANLEPILRRLIGENINLVMLLSRSPAWVKAEPGQIERVTLNLAVNARDAMPCGGSLTLQICHVSPGTHGSALGLSLNGHSYVMLSVTDTGTGMDQETQSHIFEPFFTTKEPGKGTGLGLASVYEIVRQSSGLISVDSELGKGSTFKVYLPQADSLASVSVNGGRGVGASAAGFETILIVDDQEAMRKIVRRVLEKEGYTVLEAANGMEALRLSQNHAGPIHLLVTDVVMPGMSGVNLARRLEAIRPGIKTLYMSGYANLNSTRHKLPDAAFLQKPFPAESLARKVRELLNKEPASESFGPLPFE